MPRIAFFTPAPNFGGAQRVTVTIANSLAKRGWEVDLVAGQLEGEFVSEIHDTVTTRNLDFPRVPGVGILAGIPQIMSYLSDAKPDVLFASRTHTSIAAIVASIVSDVDVHVAATEHCSYERRDSLKSQLTSVIASQVYRYADDVIAVSEGVAESVVDETSVTHEKTTVLNNPVDIDDIQDKASETVDIDWLTDPDIETIVTVGRLKSIKDYSTLLEAFALLYERRPQTRLVIVGKGPERERLESLARSLDIDEQVLFTGYTDNPYAYMDRASVFALSSKAEGLPTVLIEALACGCSVVSTDCPYGPREILVDGEYGRLTPVGDPSELAQAIEKTLEEPIPAEESKTRAEHFSMEAGADRYEAYIRSILDAG